VAGADCLDRYEMGLKVAEAFGLPSSLCRRASVADSDLIAKRGRYLCLSSKKVEAELDIRMMSFEDGLKAMRSTDPGRVDVGD